MAGWVAQRIEGCERGFADCTAMGVLKGERIVAGVVFHNWHPEAGTVELSSAAEDRRWMTRNVMTEAFGYVFDDLQCQMAVARTSTANMPARRIWAALGASQYIIPRLRGRDAAEVILTLTDDAWSNCKFRRPTDGQKRT